MKRVALLFAAVLILEAWRYVPPDVESEIRDYLDSARGRFEAWAAERDRHGDN